MQESSRQAGQLEAAAMHGEGVVGRPAKSFQLPSLPYSFYSFKDLCVFIGKSELQRVGELESSIFWFTP